MVALSYNPRTREAEAGLRLHINTLSQNSPEICVCVCIYIFLKSFMWQIIQQS